MRYFSEKLIKRKSDGEEGFSTAGFTQHGSSGPSLIFLFIFFFFPLKWDRSDHVNWEKSGWNQVVSGIGIAS